MQDTTGLVPITGSMGAREEEDRGAGEEPPSGRTCTVMIGDGAQINGQVRAGKTGRL